MVESMSSLIWSLSPARELLIWNSSKITVKFYYLRDKRYELLAKKITDAKAASIDDLGAKLVKTVQVAERSIFANPNIPSGNEPSVVAVGVYIAQGKVSGPIKGNLGVYAVREDRSVESSGSYLTLSRQTMMVQQNGMNKARAAQDALKKLAKVNDYRLNFEGN
jgi:peptidylprolyl isomerase/peptidyl-prolyl cis-trans isomerase D